jgi:hypothetical protein
MVVLLGGVRVSLATPSHGVGGDRGDEEDRQGDEDDGRAGRDV